MTEAITTPCSRAIGSWTVATELTRGSAAEMTAFVAFSARIVVVGSEAHVDAYYVFVMVTITMTPS